MGDENIFVEKMDQKIIDLGGDGFIRIMSERREKIDKLTQRVNSGNLQKKEIVIKKISRKGVFEKKSGKSKKKQKKHNDYYI
jgi:predicted transcriptional regulator